ncbi:uncharacterized protein LOC113925395 [Zalophus californianus]|uniref:Uncharacterized protein LOC113925395 n=1 Tax=Zalophus californianus TaxID=9704 RepID=A0A6J2DNP3_ZALCA|nr:uncharacterized protein LOC113925395 [Zalophus californianus]
MRAGARASLIILLPERARRCLVSADDGFYLLVCAQGDPGVRAFPQRGLRCVAGLRLASRKNRSPPAVIAVRSSFPAPGPVPRTGREAEARRQGDTRRRLAATPYASDKTAASPARCGGGEGVPRRQHPCRPVLPRPAARQQGRLRLRGSGSGLHERAGRRRALITTGQRGPAALGGGKTRGGGREWGSALSRGCWRLRGGAGPGAVLPLRPRQVHLQVRSSPTVPGPLLKESWCQCGDPAVCQLGFFPRIRSDTTPEAVPSALVPAN